MKKSFTSTVRTNVSGLSNRTEAVLQDVAAKSLSQMSRIQGVFSDTEDLSRAWIALGTYISNCLRTGKAVHIHKFGTFTFTAPQFTLPGVTNPLQRDHRNRLLVFSISKQFLNGKNIKPGIYIKDSSHGSRILQYSSFGVNGEIPVERMNATEVSIQAGLSKDCVGLALQRIVKHLSETVYVVGSKLMQKGECSVEIPNVGVLFVRRGLAAVRFNQGLLRKTRNVSAASRERRNEIAGEVRLTRESLKLFQRESHLQEKPLDFLKIDNKTKEYIKGQFGTVNDVKHQYPQKHFGMKGIKQIQKQQALAKEQQRKQQQKQLLKLYQTIVADAQFQKNFLKALSCTLDQQTATKDSILSLFKSHDPNNTGYLPQIDLKNLIQHLGLKLTQQQFAQVARMFSTDDQKNIKYGELLALLFPNPKSELVYNWYEATVRDLREWFIREKLLLKEAFRMVDRDGDGWISEKDLSMFLLNRMRYPGKELTSVRLQELIKHSDVYKQGKIDVVCFGRMINAANRPGRDWILKAKKDVSIALARQFPTLQKAFSTISHNQKKLSLLHLKKWISSNVFSDQQLITDLLISTDSSCTGFLTQHQFKSNFNLTEYLTPLASDFIKALQLRFQTPKLAYQYVANHRDLDYWQLVRAIEELLKENKYTKKDYEELWLSLAGKDKVVGLERWERMVGRGSGNGKGKGEWGYVAPSKEPREVEVGRYSQEELLVVRLAKSRKLLGDRLEHYNRRGFVEYSIVEQAMKELMYDEKLRFEDQIYKKVIDKTNSLANNKVNLQKLFEALRIRAEATSQFPRDQLKYCC